MVTAAGIDRCGTLADVPADEWERVVSVNLLGTVSVVRAALPELVRSGGTVVTVASTLGVKAVSRRHRLLRRRSSASSASPGR